MKRQRYLHIRNLIMVLLLGFILVACSGRVEDGYEAVNNQDTIAQDVAESHNPITKEEIMEAQTAWANGILSISEAFMNDQDYRAVAQEILDTLYGYKDGIVLFKPTKASEVPFRFTEESALSYFVTGSIPEDEGFAINPWVAIRFDDDREFILNGDTALSMGNYYFTAPDSDEEIRVEFSFGYYRDDEGNLRIQLHHSSVPFS